MTRRWDALLFTAAIGVAGLLLLAISVVSWPSVRAAPSGPTVALYDAAGGQQIPAGGQACGIQAKGEGFQPNEGIDSEVDQPSGQVLSSFHDVADADGVWHGQGYYPIIGGLLSFQWKAASGGGSIAFVNVCTAAPLPVVTPKPTNQATVRPSTTPRPTVLPTMPATDTE